MDIIQKSDLKGFPFKWVNLSNYSESKGNKTEIYLHDRSEITNGLFELFFNLFNECIPDVLIYSDSWWDFTIETWSYENETYNYSTEGKSKETIDYLLMLEESGIEKGYSGVCECSNWAKFLQIILSCITSHKAIYSPIFYDKNENFFFYFHHTGSIGLYYEKENTKIINILDLAKVNYLIE